MKQTQTYLKFSIQFHVEKDSIHDNTHFKLQAEATEW